ncbi:MAG: hypothetical protein K6G40_07680 [Eubacterium sp.]|nr:hypothetical protein [Eubacterium sp.]
MEYTWLLIVAMVGHILNWYCDRLLFCTSSGTFKFSDMKDNEKMAAVFKAMPENAPIRSIGLGTLAMCLQLFGYLTLGIWMQQYSPLWANLMIVGAALIYTFGLAYHVVGGSAEWIYIKSGHTEHGRELTEEFFRKNSATMIGCFIGIFMFSITFFIPVVVGITPLPAWACVFNMLPVYLVLAPFHIPGAGNIAGAVMYFSLLLLFLL